MARAIALMSVIGIYFLAGIPGLGVALYMLVLFEIFHQRVHGKSISEV